MKKYILLLFPYYIFAQVGLGTQTPKGMLDVNSSDSGLLIPRVTKIEDVTDGNGNDPVDGTVVYDISRDKTCFRIDGCWIGVGKDVSNNPVVARVNPKFSTVSHYIKASNTETIDQFGSFVSISADGEYLAVGALGEDSSSTGINGNQSNNSASGSGAVYVFRKSGSTWVQEAYIKASNAEVGDRFGMVKLSADGSRLAVTADNEDSNATGINGNQSNNSGGSSGAVYVFRRSGTTWTQEAYIKASNTDAGDHLGNFSLALSDDGSVLAVGAYAEDSNATGVNGNQWNNSADFAGALYVFVRIGTTWSQQAYIKASNTEADDHFGRKVVLSGDGTRLAVSAENEASSATGINGSQGNGTNRSGAVYVFFRSGNNWSQEAYIKASNTGYADFFGSSLALNYDGSILAVGAPLDDSSSTGINGSQTGGVWNDNYGSAFIFSRSGSTWSQDAYIKPSTADINDGFGFYLSLNSDGTRLAVASRLDSSSATGVDGDESDNSAPAAGAIFVFGRENGTWFQESYVKASNSEENDAFGTVSISSGCRMIMVAGAANEDSSATGINGNQSNNSAAFAGAVYIIE